jgi:hypothetical protein
MPFWLESAAIRISDPALELNLGAINVLTEINADHK